MTTGTLQDNLASGNFDSIEDACLTELERDPSRVSDFVAAAQGLIDIGEEERANLLLELVDDQLREQGLWEERLELLRLAGNILYSPEQLHDAIVDSLGQRYSDSDLTKALIRMVGLERAPEDIPKTWEKVGRFRDLIVYDVGAIVTMEGKGAGRVVEVNLELQCFKVDFEIHQGLSVGFRGAAKLLRALPPGDILRRKIEDPESLRELRDNDPSRLLELTLTSSDRAMTAGEIREALRGVVDEKQWSSWWNAARKHPQVVTKVGGRQSYSWAASDSHAQAAVWEAFEKGDPKTKLDLLRKNGERDPDLRQRMIESLGAIGARARRGDPALALEIWSGLARTGEAPEDETWSPSALLTASTDPRALVAGIGDRSLREQAYEILRSERDDWSDLGHDLFLQEEDARGLDALALLLRREDEDSFLGLIDELLRQPAKAPAAFTWLAERAARDEELMGRNPLRLVQQILAVLPDGKFSSYKQRLLKLAESGGTIPRLIPLLSVEQAAQVEDLVNRSGALQDFRRTPLINALHLRFPDLRQTTEDLLYARPESIQAHEKEFQELLKKEIPANRKAIEEARALGDLRENFEYKSARQRHEYLAARAATLERDLNRARPLDPAKIDTSEVRIGTRLELASGDQKRALTILGPWESSPEKGILSYESELGQSLLGKKPGDSVELDGTTWSIEGIGTFL
ncbi:MAG TPA: GreA/GreB family elongation factor [Thermoanaerobaculia bacterium]|nr:GreA/GreB family elongation factor [Thermoanaerobaculia bacterium]